MSKKMGLLIVMSFAVFAPSAFAKRKPAKKETMVGHWIIPAGDGSPQGVADLNEDKSYILTLDQADGTKRTIKGKYHLTKPYTIFFKDVEGFGNDCRGEGSYDYAQRGESVFFTLRNDRCMDRIHILKVNWKRQEAETPAQ